MLHAILNSGTMTAAEIRDWLTAERRDRKPTEEATWSIAGMAREFGAEAAEGIYRALNGAGLCGLAVRFCSVGIDAGDPQWTEQVDALAVAVPALAPLAPTIRDLGYDTRPMWERMGLPEAPDIKTIEGWKSDAVKSYDFRQVLLSANMNPDGMGLVVRIMACDANGRTSPGSGQLAGSVVLRAGQAKGSAKVLYDTVQLAVAAYLKSVEGA